MTYTVGRLRKQELTLTGILNAAKTTGPLKRRSLHCGDVGFCARKAVVLMFTDRTVTNDGSSNLYMAIGTAIHNTIEGLLKSASILVADEFRITTIGGVPISGYVDAVIQLDKELAVLEIKSCGKAPACAKPEHVAQAVVYGFATSIKRKIILYMGRNVRTFDGLDLTEFEVEDDKELIGEVARNIATAHLYKEAQLVPPARPDASANVCGFCPFIDECVSERDAGAKPKWPLTAPTYTIKREFDEPIDELTDRIVTDYTSCKATAAAMDLRARAAVL
jgi:hypothetical protein